MKNRLIIKKGEKMRNRQCSNLNNTRTLQMPWQWKIKESRPRRCTNMPAHALTHSQALLMSTTAIKWSMTRNCDVLFSYFFFFCLFMNFFVLNLCWEQFYLVAQQGMIKKFTIVLKIKSTTNNLQEQTMEQKISKYIICYTVWKEDLGGEI